MKRALLILFTLAATTAWANGSLPPDGPITELTIDTRHRSQMEKRHFAKAHPCPVTQLPVPSCKGYVIDHIVPLCAGGPDKATNMQWQTVEYAGLKDKIEKGYCACTRRLGVDKCPKVQWQ